MQRWIAVLLVLVVPMAGAQTTAGVNPDGAPVSDAFGAGGLPTWTTHVPPASLPGTANAGEPTLGIPWATDDVFYKSRSYTYRISFDDGYAPTWELAQPLFLVTDVDPMLHADPDTNRIWTGGLDGPCSLMAYSDDNGESWLPTGNMCSGAEFDHQSIGSGPWKDPLKAAVYPHATYYCAQLALTACATSLDGGVTWEPFTQVLGPCGGLHGHIRVSPVTGTAIVPHRNCGREGFAYTTNDGLTWSSREIQVSPGDTEFDPSAQFTRDSGWLYYGDATPSGAFIGLSKDEGVTWEKIGQGHGQESRFLDVGRLHDPPIVAATFADVQAGDDGRVAYSFLGLIDLDGDGSASEYGDMHGQCTQNQDIMAWHYYVAMSYDAGKTWTVQQASTDPVQLGSIWMGQGNVCRNLLDFNDMDIDSQGRVHIGYSDGCTGSCAIAPEPGTSGYRSREVRVLRQSTGMGLFAAYDLPDATPPLPPAPEPPLPDDDPGGSVALELRLSGYGNGTRLDPGPHAIEGRIFGPVPEGGGRVEARLDGEVLASDPVAAHPQGAIYIINALIDAPGSHVLSVHYLEGGDERAHIIRHIEVTDPGTGEPAQVLPRLQVLDVSDGQATLRLERLGGAVDGGWRLMLDGEQHSQGRLADLPQEVVVDLPPGAHEIRLEWTFPPHARDDAIVTVEANRESPVPMLVPLALALGLFLRRRR